MRRVLAAEEWRLGGSDSLTPARPDQSRLRERAGRREEEGAAERLSPGRGAGRDPASSAWAAPGRPDPGPGTPLARPLVRPRGWARRQPGKTKQTRTQLSPLSRPRPLPSAPWTSSAAAAAAASSTGAGAGPQGCRCPRGRARAASRRPRRGGGSSPRGADRGPPSPPPSP